MVFDKNMIENKDIIKKLSQQYEKFLKITVMEE